MSEELSELDREVAGINADIKNKSKSSLANAKGSVRREASANS